MARCILVVGAGKSTSYLLDYLLDKTREERLNIIIADKNPEGIPEELHTLSLIHISEPTRPFTLSRMPSSA